MDKEEHNQLLSIKEACNTWRSSTAVEPAIFGSGEGENRHMQERDFSLKVHFQ